MFWVLFYFWGVGGFQFVVISIRVVSSVPKCRRINIEASRSTLSGRNDVHCQPIGDRYKIENSLSQFWNRQIMKVFLTMLLLPCCTVGLLREGIAELDDMEQYFEAFVAQHGRVYATVQERAHRFAIFKVCASLFFPAYLFCLHHTLSQYSTPNMLTAACPHFAHPRNVPP